MGSPGGVGGSSGSSNSGGASGGSGNDNAPSDNDRDNTSSANSKNESSQSGMTGSERTAVNPSFSDALSDAAKGPERDDDDADRSDDNKGTKANDRSSGMTDAAGGTFGGLSDPTTIDTDRTADDAAQAAARDSHPANEFSGLGASGGPVDNNLPGPESENSHRGYGPDSTNPNRTDVQSRLNDLDQQIAEQKANESPYAPLYDTRDTPNVNTPENPTELNTVPEATSVVYSGDTTPLTAHVTGDGKPHDFATNASANAAIVGGMSGIAEAALANHLTPDAVGHF